MLSVEKILWQPRLYGRCEFGIYLDGNFAKEMIQSRTIPEKQDKLNKLANEELEKFRIRSLNPYTFYGDSCFVNQVHIGGNGVWLSINHQTIEDLLKKDKPLPVEYHSHNVDIPKDAYILIVLFDNWVEYARVLRGN